MRCVDGHLSREDVAGNEVVISSFDQVKCMDKFCYLGDMIGSGGGAEEESLIARVHCA